MPHLDSREAIALAFPVLAMLFVAIALVFYSVKSALAGHRHPRRRRRSIGIVVSSAVIGMAFLPLSIIYRPNLEEVAKAQIRHQEAVEEDDNGDPESPLKHLMRQLRRIRRGGRVERLSLRVD